MSRNILDGKWVDILTHQQFNQFQNGRCNKGKFIGPGPYFILNYTQLCPRGCCYDDVTEIMFVDEAIKEIKEIKDKMADLAYLLKRVREFYKEIPF